MRVIDAHVHLYPPDANRDPSGWALAQGEPQWAELCTRVRKSGQAVQSFPSVEELLREMDRAEVERALLLGWYWQRIETCVLQNRFYADCVRGHPDRFSAFCTVQPTAGVTAVRAEMQRAKDDGLIGLGEISPHAQGCGIDDAALHGALEFAAESHWPVNLHVTDSNSVSYPGRVETPLEDFVRLATAHPATTLILAHWGGLLPLRDATARNLANVFYDTAASPLLYDDTVWARFLATTPPAQVLFGSDYPLNNFPKLDNEPGMSRFIEEARAAGASADVMRNNALRLLRL